MAKSCTLLVVALVLITVQSVLSHVGVADWAIPQGLISCVTFLTFFERGIGGVCGAFALGLLLDLTSATLVGPWAGAFVCVFVVVSLLSQRLFVESMLVAIITTALCTLLAGAVYLLLAFEYQALSFTDLSVLGGQAVASALFTPVVFRALGRAWSRRSVSSLNNRSQSLVSAV